MIHQMVLVATIIFGFKRDVVGFNNGFDFDFNCGVLTTIEPTREEVGYGAAIIGEFLVSIIGFNVAVLTTPFEYEIKRYYHLPQQDLNLNLVQRYQQQNEKEKEK